MTTFLPPSATPPLTPNPTPTHQPPQPTGGLRRLAVALAALLGGGVLVGGAVVSVYAMHSLPRLDGQGTLAGQSADVTHILASQPLDAYRALGMMHAQERPWHECYPCGCLINPEGTQSECMCHVCRGWA